MRQKTAQHLSTQVKNSYNQIAEHFSQTRHTPWAEFQYFQKHLQENQKILDLGCGNGRLLKFLKDHFQAQKFTYLGLDNSKELIKKAQEIHPDFQFKLADQERLPLKNHTQNIIFSIAAFHHLPSKKLRSQALQEMHRVLEKDGLLIMTVWNLWQRKYLPQIFSAFIKSIITFGDYQLGDLFIPWKNAQKQEQNKRYYHSFFPSELKKLFHQNGFQVIEEFSAKKGQKVKFLQGYNYCLVARKIN
ncbi:MAG: class I SAM-dependent methyltransferase [Candidatus Altimarinota bacterium]